MNSDHDAAVREEAARSPDDVLHCWKDIAGYLQRDLRTVMRWEHTRALPVHRLPGGPKAAVYALKSELELWRAARSSTEAAEGQNAEQSSDEFVQDTGHQSAKTGGVGRVARRILFAGAILVGIAFVVLAARVAWRVRPAASARIHSLAVLPFENLNNDPAQEYIASGVHEALITELARSSDVRVISNTSVMRYRGVRVPAAQIARELNVDGLVEGSVLRVGNRVRITAQLVRAETDAHLWARSYDRDLQDILGLMAEVSDSITGEVQSAAGIGRKQHASALVVRAISPEALDTYLRAQYGFQSLTRDGMQNALKLFRKSIEQEPNFAQGWLGVAKTLTAQAFFAYAPAAEVLPEARAAANRALTLDERLGGAHGILGYIALYWDRDFETARKTLSRAIELSPNDTMVRHEYADYLLVTRNPEESLEQIRIAQTYNPQWPQAKAILLYHAFMARHYDEVVVEGRKMMQISARPIFHDWVGRALWLKGRETEALAEWKIAMQGNENGFRRVEQAYRGGGAKTALLAMGEQNESNAEQGKIDSVHAASWFAAAGDANRAMPWLERSLEKREPLLLHIVADPFFDPIRSDPRFKSLLQQIREPSH